MSRSLALAAAACLACGPTVATPPAPEAASSAVRLATWNVHDLFDEVDDLTPPGDGDTVPSAAEVAAKLTRVGEVLRRIDADVVVLQEVEHLALLERLAAGPLAGLGYAAVLTEGRDPRGIDVGVLTRLPVEEVRSHLDDRGADGALVFARDLLEVHLGGAARRLVVLGAHLASRLDPAADDRRRRQAARARQVADGLGAADPEALVVLLGDLNDLPAAASLAPLLADGALADLGAALPADRGWTWSGSGAQERIDYALLPRGDGGAVAGVQTVGGPDVSAASDHRPVVLDLWVEPAGRLVRAGKTGCARAR